MSEPVKPDVKPGRFAWMWAHRHTIAPFVGIALALACPHLGPVAGPCRIVASAVRAWSFDGIALP